MYRVIGYGRRKRCYYFRGCEQMGTDTAADKDCEQQESCQPEPEEHLDE
jgi:hypothetical protein